MNPEAISLIVTSCLAIWLFIRFMRWGAKSLSHAIVLVAVLPVVLIGGRTVGEFSFEFLRGFLTPLQSVHEATLRAEVPDVSTAPLVRKPHKPLDLTRLK